MKFKDSGLKEIDLKVKWSDNDDGWTVKSPQIDNVVSVEKTIPKALKLFATFFKDMDKSKAIGVFTSEVFTLKELVTPLVVHDEIDIDEYQYETICNESCYFKSEGYCTLYSKSLNLSNHSREFECCHACTEEF